MRSTLKRTAAITLVVMAGLLASAGVAGATCVPGTRLCLPESGPGAGDHAGGAVTLVQDTVGDVHYSGLVGLEKVSGAAAQVQSDVDDAAQGLGSGTGPIPPLPPGIKPVVDRAVADVEAVVNDIVNRPLPVRPPGGVEPGPAPIGPLPGGPVSLPIIPFP